MKKTGITEADVRRAVQHLLNERRVPSPTNVRLELGRGSYSTIGPLLKVVLDKRARGAAVPAVNSALQARSAELLSELWQSAFAEAGVRMEELRSDCEARIGELTHQLDEREASIDHLEFEIIRLRGLLKDEELRTQALSVTISSLEREVQQLQAVVEEQRRDRTELLDRLQAATNNAALLRAA